MPLELIAFIIGTATLAWLSRKSLRSPGQHGFYRFFAWEAILGLIILNREVWGTDPFSAYQIASWLLMLLSIFLVIQAYRLMTKHGQATSFPICFECVNHAGGSFVPINS